MALKAGYDKIALEEFAKATGYPLFVKPIKSGSSYGVTKVREPKELPTAVELAFGFDNEVLVEEGIAGFEVACAVMGNDDLLVGEVAEIEIHGELFDFNEKYTHASTVVHIPARISQKLTHKVKETAKTLYKALACRGFARVDVFITPDERIVFNEINTIPGFTEHSLYPGMMKAIGISFAEVVEQLVELALQ
jgi:D-alanine---D-serine ligase